MRNELIDFCERNLKDGLDPVRYADGLIDETDDQYFEIRGTHTKTGNPVTIDLRD